MLFDKFLNEKRIVVKEWSRTIPITIQETDFKKLRDNKHGEGMTQAHFDTLNGKLDAIEILIARFSDTKTCRVLLHELGHVRDFLTRTNELEEMHKNKNVEANLKFDEESEYFAFQYCLEEAKKLFFANEPDILKSALYDISNRNDHIKDEDLIYQLAIKRIMGTPLWDECCALIEN